MSSNYVLGTKLIVVYHHKYNVAGSTPKHLKHSLMTWFTIEIGDLRLNLPHFNLHKSVDDHPAYNIIRVVTSSNMPMQ